MINLVGILQKYRDISTAKPQSEFQMKPKTPPPVTKRPLSYWVRISSLKLQLLLLLIIVVTVFSRIVPLEMQKRIVNEAINLRKLDLLLVYCGIYLAAVIAQGALKYLINLIETLIGQRTLAQMRKDLFHHILTLPLGFFRRTQPGLVVTSLVAELTTAGTFVGMALAVPITNILTLAAFAGYLFWLNPLLAAISLSIYPVVLFLIPLLQKKANSANKERVDTTRIMSDKIAESISGIHEIQGNGAFGIESAKFNGVVNRLLKIRIVWTLFTQGIKTLNNFFTNLSPFLIFLVGGWLAMNGRLELGALVAFLSAQEKLYQPWKDLIEFYQVYQDASIRYKRSMEYFDTEADHGLLPESRPPYVFEGSLKVQDLSMVVEGGVRLLNDISFEMKPGEHLALVGFSGSGKSTLALCVGQLYKYSGGHIWIDDKEVSEMTKKDMADNVGFVSQSPFIFSGSIEENLLYGCRAIREAAGGKEGQLPTLDDIIAVLQQTGIFVDVLRFGLNTVLPKDQNGELVTRILRVRRKFQKNFGEKLAEYVEFFNDNKYLYYSSVIENLTFGTANEEQFQNENLLHNSDFLAFLEDAQLSRPLLSLGGQLAEQTVDILGNMPPDKLLFEMSPILPEELDEYKQVVERTKKTKLHRLNAEDRSKLLQLSFRFTPGIHRTVALPQIIENLIVEGRAMFRDKISAEAPQTFTFFDASRYIHSETILNNIFFGKMKGLDPRAQEKINQSIIHLLIEEDFLEKVIEIGMQFEVGSKGDRLSGGQKQKLAIARVFLKKPRILIMDEATSALDNSSQARIQNILENRWKGKSTLIAVVHRLDIIRNFDRVAVMKAGKIGEIGTYDELIAKKGLLYELEFGRK